MNSMIQEGNRLAMVDVAAMLYQQKIIMFLVFCLSMAAATTLVWEKPLNYGFSSIIEVGARGLDVPLEQPDLLVERIQEIYMPRYLAAHRKVWAESGKSDFSLQVFYKAGSRIIKLHSDAPLDREADVQRLHNGILQQLLVDNKAQFDRIKNVLTSRKTGALKIMASGKKSLSQLDIARKESELSELEINLVNLSMSSVSMLAMPGIKQAAFTRTQLTGFAAVFSVLLALLAGGVSIFIQAVRARLA